MDVESKSTHRQRELRILYVRLGVALLLVAITGFVTLAKKSQYSPRFVPDHYLNISSKMKMTPLPAVADRSRVMQVPSFIPPYPSTSVRAVESNVIEYRSIAVTLSLRHRSPPFLPVVRPFVQNS
jgi:hypothetical protein